MKKTDKAIREWTYGDSEEIMVNEGQEIAKSYLYGKDDDTTHSSQKKRSETLNELFGDHKDSHDTDLIGKKVTVTIDRPLGSYHPNYPDMYYPVNYGYVDGIMSADGEYQDAYVLGVDVPVKSFSGVIIAIVHRDDDVEEKWVVAPEGVNFTAEEIMEQISFTEKYYRSHIIQE